MTIEPRNPFETADDGVTDLQEKIGGLLEDADVDQKIVDAVVALIAESERAAAQQYKVEQDRYMKYWAVIYTVPTHREHSTWVKEADARAEAARLNSTDN